MLLEQDFDVSTDELTPLELTLESHHRLEQFLFHEARLLDKRRLYDWMALWTDDGMYWVPQQHDQLSPHDHISLIWEGKMLREVRTRRLNNPRNWSQQPHTRTARLVGNVSAGGLDREGRWVVHAVLQLSEWRNGELRQLAGALTYKLQVQGESWRIHFKRVDLINCDAVFQNLQVFV
jgi:ethylbenzene dioxygenase beta subunit